MLKEELEKEKGDKVEEREQHERKKRGREE